MLCWVNFKWHYIWISYNYIIIASQLSILRFNISKSSRYWQSSWEHSMRSKHYLRLRIFHALVSLLDRCILVNSAIVVEDSIHLILFHWLMVLRKTSNFPASFRWKNSSTITSIANITHVINDQTNDCTRATSIYFTNITSLGLSEL
jgi:hypothetical protein